MNFNLLVLIALTNALPNPTPTTIAPTTNSTPQLTPSNNPTSENTVIDNLPKLTNSTDIPPEIHIVLKEIKATSTDLANETTNKEIDEGRFTQVVITASNPESATDSEELPNGLKSTREKRQARVHIAFFTPNDITKEPRIVAATPC